MTSIGSARAELATASPESSDAGTTDRSLFIIGDYLELHVGEMRRYVVS